MQIGRVVERRISSKRKKILSIDADWAPLLRRWQCQKTHRRAASGANESWTEQRRFSKIDPDMIDLFIWNLRRLVERKPFQGALDHNLAKVGVEGSNPFARGGIFVFGDDVHQNWTETPRPRAPSFECSMIGRRSG